MEFNFKTMLESLSKLSEAETRKVAGRAYGGAAQADDSDDEDDEGKKKEPAVKRGRGRPRKGADDTGQVKKYDPTALTKAMGIGKPSGKAKVGIKHKISDKETVGEAAKSFKDWINRIEEATVPAGMKPLAILDPKNQQAGAGVLTSPNPAIQKMLGGIDPKDVKIVQTTGGTSTQPAATTGQPAPAGATGQPAAGQQQVKEKWGTETNVSPEEKGKYSGKSKAELLKSYNALKKSGPHKKGSPEFGRMRELAFAIRAKSGWGKVKEEGEVQTFEGYMGFEKVKAAAEKGGAKDPGAVAAAVGHKKYGKTAFQKAAAAGKKMGEDKVNEVQSPAYDSTAGAGLGAGRNEARLEEGMIQRLKAARHAGKSHALAKEGYNCRYDDMEEARHYHEGYKEGLDECYGQMPIQGYVGEEDVPATVPGMADQALDEMDMEEGNAFTAALAKTPKGGKFSVGGKTFTDRTGYDADIEEDYSMFESWDKELNQLINEDAKVNEGISASVSKGQANSPDTVSIIASDNDADELMSIMKAAGMGIFGGEEAEPKAQLGAPEEQSGEIEVVDDHDGMMSLIKKVVGGQGGSQEQAYKDEEGHEETCEMCGESQCSCDSEEQVDEVQSEDQMTYQVAEDNPPDSGAEETAATDEEVAADNAAASNSGGATNESSDDEEDEEDDEETVEESYANAADDTFEADIAFMTKAISGGLNKPKSTGQTTIPVIPGQEDRMGYSSKNTNESVSDWKKLAGI